MNEYEKTGYLNSNFKIFHLIDEKMTPIDFHFHDFHKILLDEKEKGKIILLASHNKEDIDILCDKVFVMENGVLIKK